MSTLERLFPGLMQRRGKRIAMAYAEVFAGPAGQIVLQDLAKFAGLDQDLFDPQFAARRDFMLGQRRVLLRIAKFLETTELDLVRQVMAATEAAKHEPEGVSS